MKKVFAILTILVDIFAISSCTEELSPDSFPKPKFLSYSIETQTASAIINYSMEGAFDSKTSCYLLYDTNNEQSLDGAKKVSGQTSAGKVVTFVISALQSYTDYYFKVVVSNGVESMESSISTFKTQELLEPSSNYFSFDYKGGMAIIDISAIAEPQIKIVNAPWITLGETKSATYTKHLLIAENSTLDERTATVEIIGKSITKEITISQFGKPVTIPDPIFKSYILSKYDEDKDGEISKAEGEKITEIRLNNNLELESVEGIEHFPNLEILNLEIDNGDPRQGKMTSLDVSSNPKLRELVICRQSVEALDVTHNPELVFLNVYGNALTELDVSKNTKLSGFCSFSNNFLTSFDFSNCPDITDFYIHSNKLEIIKLPPNASKLKVFNVADNKLERIDAGAMTNVESFSVNDNQLKELILPPSSNLSELNVAGNYPTLPPIDFSSYHNLIRLDISRDRNVLDVDLSNHPKLKYLHLNDTDISNVDLSALQDLQYLNIGGCQNLKTLDVSENKQLTDLYCHCDKLRILYIHKGQDLPGVTRDRNPEEWRLHEGTQIYCKDDPDNFTYVDIPDAVFRKYCLDNFDFDNDSKLSVAEAKSVYQINMNNLDKYYSLSGIENFVNLRKLFCESASEERESGHLTSLDLSHNLKLKELRLSKQTVRNLDLSKNTLLEIAYLPFSSLESINLKGLKALKTLDIGECHNIKSIDVSDCTELIDFCANNLGLSSMPDLSHNHKLQAIHICGRGGANFLTNPNFSTDYPELRFINLWGYQGNYLNFTENSKMQRMWIGGMQNVTEFDLRYMPDLNFLCVNDCVKLQRIILSKNIDRQSFELEKNNCPANLEIIYK